MAGRLLGQPLTMWVAVALTMTGLAGCIEAPAAEETPDDGGMSRASSPKMADPLVECAPYTGHMETSGGQGIDGQSGVTSAPGGFSYGGQVFAKMETESYTWSNPADGAVFSWGGRSLTGELVVRIIDACGEVALEKSISMLTQSGSFETQVDGTAGDWTIELEFTLFTGQMGLTVSSG